MRLTLRMLQPSIWMNITASNRENPQSYYYYMNNNLFKHINIKPENTHIPNGTAPDIAEECALYENKIKKQAESIFVFLV